MSNRKEPDLSGSVADQARSWVVELDAGDVSPEDKARFARWLDEDPIHRRIFDEQQQKWRQFDAARRLRSLHPDPTALEPSLQRKARRQWMVPAALAAMLVIVACSIWLLQAPSLYEFEYRTGVGERRTVDLPDESRMTLNTGSRARIRYSGNERRIELEQGEALFEVEADRRRPFLVIAGNGTLRATGTAFSVYLRGDAVEVTVTEGTVEVLALVQTERKKLKPSATGSAPQGARTLGKQDKIRYSPQAIEATVTVSPEEIERTLAWRHGMLDFEAKPLAEVVAEANRYMQDRFVIIDPAVRSLEFTGYFQAGDAELLMSLLNSNEVIDARRVDPRTVHIASSIDSRQEH
jgi:transmembrane sensor